MKNLKEPMKPSKLSRELRQYLEAEKALEKIREREEHDSLDEYNQCKYVDALFERLSKADKEALDSGTGGD